MTKKVMNELNDAIKNNKTEFKFDLSRLNKNEVIPCFKQLKDKGFEVEIESEQDKDWLSLRLEFKKVKLEKVEKSKPNYKIENEVIKPAFKGSN